jgi:pantoate--beta-alanine ligase
MTNPQVVTTAAELEEWSTVCHQKGEKVVIVPTMGNLHLGHLALVNEAKKHGDRVVVSIFVNPTQFSEGEDFERYPRTLEADIDALSGVGVDVVFAPSADEVYPEGSEHDAISAGPIGEVLEGAIRPGHFDAVVTVCKRLFEMSHADVAVFGEKDAQQLFLVTQMARGLTPPVSIVGVPTVRDHDGLALSSRNSYLSIDDRQAALALPHALEVLEQRVNHGDKLRAAVSAAQLEIAGDPAIDLDYLESVNPDTFEPSWESDSQALILGAITVGGTRLIDNRMVQLSR